jgi:hypothetical protein
VLVEEAGVLDALARTYHRNLQQPPHAIAPHRVHNVVCGVRFHRRHFPRRLAAQCVDHRILSGYRNVDRGRIQHVARNNRDVRLPVLRGAAHESRHLMPRRQRLIYQRLSALARCSKHQNLHRILLLPRIWPPMQMCDLTIGRLL